LIGAVDVMKKEASVQESGNVVLRRKVREHGYVDMKKANKSCGGSTQWARRYLVTVGAFDARTMVRSDDKAAVGEKWQRCHNGKA
jgi:hypothetical protein